MERIQATEEFLKEARFYLKKAMPIKAIQIKQPFWVASLEGKHKGKPGDYLIRGIRGELYICDKGIFEESYILV